MTGIDLQELGYALITGKVPPEITWQDLAREVQRLRTGEAAIPREEVGARFTPAEFIRFWNDLTPPRRLEVARQILSDSDAAAQCFQMNHDALLQEVHDLRDALINIDMHETGVDE